MTGGERPEFASHIHGRPKKLDHCVLHRDLFESTVERGSAILRVTLTENKNVIKK